MNTGRISVRYAKALFDLANESKVAKEVYDHSYAVSKTIDPSSDFYYVLHNPVILPSEKERILTSVLGGKVHPMLTSFIALMVRKRRESYIVNALLVFQKIYREHTGLAKVVVETPAELGDDTKNRILEFVKNKFNKTPELEVRLKPELIGGFIVEVEGLLIDLSVSGQLARVRKALVQNQRVL
ncbi:MAG: ATP synthase F1 subunit delta [Bacteroidales bacterium]|nr:MAG: ATP synthase F1 subunit delta [Bacteroidales bacterium]